MIKFIRSAIVLSLLSLFGFGALFIRYFIFPFQKTRKENYTTLQKSWQFFIWLLEKTKIIKIQVKDIEKIKNIKNSIIVSTHPSFLDIVILMSIIPYSTCFVAERLARNPFFKGMVSLLFILEEEDIDSWMNESCKRLDDGLNLIIFPMGIRHRKTEYPKIRRGTALIAQKSQKDIVMLKLENNYDFLQINQPIYEAGESEAIYTLEYLDEIDVKKYLAEYPDQVSFKTAVTKKMTKTLYNIQK